MPRRQETPTLRMLWEGAVMTTTKGTQQWSVSTEDPRLILTQEAPDLQARAVACVRKRCPDHVGLILEMLDLSEATP